MSSSTLSHQASYSVPRRSYAWPPGAATLAASSMQRIVAAARCYPGHPGADEEEYAERRPQEGAGPRLRAPAWTVRRSSPSEPGGTPPDGREARVVAAGAAASRVVPREPGSRPCSIGGE